MNQNNQTDIFTNITTTCNISGSARLYNADINPNICPHNDNSCLMNKCNNNSATYEGINLGVPFCGTDFKSNVKARWTWPYEPSCVKSNENPNLPNTDIRQLFTDFI